VEFDSVEMSPVADASRFSASGLSLLQWLGLLEMHSNRHGRDVSSRLKVGAALCDTLELGNDDLPWPPTLGRRSQILVGSSMCTLLRLCGWASFSWCLTSRLSTLLVHKIALFLSMKAGNGSFEKKNTDMHVCVVLAGRCH
jgi:hypothetical protein